MKSSPRVVAFLKDIYVDEIRAANQYQSHAATVLVMGLPKLAAKFNERYGDESKHADAIRARLARYGLPALAYSGNVPATNGNEQDVSSMLSAQRTLEVGAVKKYEDAIKVCCEEGDNDTRELFVNNLKDEGDHVEEIETDQGLIERITIENFEQAMM